MAVPKSGFYIVGGEGVIKKLLAAKALEQKKREMAVKRACIHLERSVKQKFGEGGSIAGHTGFGRQYRRQKGKGKGRWHTASAPGQPPAVDTGRLRASITHNVKNRPHTEAYSFKEGADSTTLPATGSKRTRTIGLVGTNLEYARPLEFGSPSRNLLPRPYMWPTLMEQQKKIAAILKAGVTFK